MDPPRTEMENKTENECDWRAKETLAPKMMRQVFKENNIITYQSHEVNRLYVINFGRVKITIEDFNIGELTQGHFWGEQICLKPLTNSTATYTASCVCMTYSLEKKSFHDILRKHPNEMKNFQTPPPDEEAQLARAANPELQLSSPITEPKKANIVSVSAIGRVGATAPPPLNFGRAAGFFGWTRFPTKNLRIPNGSRRGP